MLELRRSDRCRTDIYIGMKRKKCIFYCCPSRYLNFNTILQRFEVRRPWPTDFFVSLRDCKGRSSFFGTRSESRRFYICLFICLRMQILDISSIDTVWTGFLKFSRKSSTGSDRVGTSDVVVRIPETYLGRPNNLMVFARSNTELVGLNPTGDMDVCASLFCVCIVLLCR
jgi:hypothetical protein